MLLPLLIKQQTTSLAAIESKLFCKKEKHWEKLVDKMLLPLLIKQQTTSLAAIESKLFCKKEKYWEKLVKKVGTKSKG